MKNKFHAALLTTIRKKSGKGTQHTFLDSYLGNSHPRYAINAPTLRAIGKDFMNEHRGMSAVEFVDLVDSLIHGESSTEKCFAGMLLDLATKEQRQFDPSNFDQWLEHLIGWAEIDSVCTGRYTIHEIPAQWPKWKKLLLRFNKSKNIQKRRASLVLLCSPIRHCDDPQIASTALALIDNVKSEREVLITKAISWLLRSMVKHHKQLVSSYVRDNREELPAIAVRETLTVLNTGKKTKSLAVPVKK